MGVRAQEDGPRLASPECKLWMCLFIKIEPWSHGDAVNILFLSGRELDYPRNDVLVRALQRLGQVRAIGGYGAGGLLLSSLGVALRSIPRLILGRYDLVVVGFYGHLLMLPAGWIARAPVLFDAFVSTYDTLVTDRARFKPGSLPARLAGWLDRTALDLSSHVLIDTPQHRAFFMETFGLAEEQISALPVGCNEGLFFPRPAPRDQPAQVLYYATYLPLHGVDVVVRAAAELVDLPDLRLRIIGRGPEYARVRALAGELELENVDFQPPVALRELPGELARARIGLGGHFGATPKAARVVPGKVYQILAMARPLIAADTPANRRLLRHKEQAWLVPPGDPAALAQAIRTLLSDLEGADAMGRRGRTHFQACCGEVALTRQIGALAAELLR
jgi:glycosyltransferase involved in cell wall biosynthesis